MHDPFDTVEGRYVGLTNPRFELLDDDAVEELAWSMVPGAREELFARFEDEMGAEEAEVYIFRNYLGLVHNLKL